VEGIQLIEIFKDIHQTISVQPSAFLSDKCSAVLAICPNILDGGSLEKLRMSSLALSTVTVLQDDEQPLLPTTRMTSKLFSGPRLNPPHKAEHIGSLLRPAELIKKRAEFSAGKCSEQDLKEVERKAISAIVNMQREIGLKIMTDGEFSRFRQSRS
jgi:hypothetical protein